MILLCRGDMFLGPAYSVCLYMQPFLVPKDYTTSDGDTYNLSDVLAHPQHKTRPIDAELTLALAQPTPLLNIHQLRLTSTHLYSPSTPLSLTHDSRPKAGPCMIFMDLQIAGPLGLMG